jgi:hypothetical protein
MRWSILGLWMAIGLTITGCQGRHPIYEITIDARGDIGGAVQQTRDVVAQNGFGTEAPSNARRDFLGREIGYGWLHSVHCIDDLIPCQRPTIDLGIYRVETNDWVAIMFEDAAGSGYEMNGRALDAYRRLLSALKGRFGADRVRGDPRHPVPN